MAALRRDRARRAGSGDGSRTLRAAGNRANPLRPSWVFVMTNRRDSCRLSGARPLGPTGAFGNGAVPAFYSGSPELAGTVNLVRLTAAGETKVTRAELQWPR
jgi:hypothetical protein